MSKKERVPPNERDVMSQEERGVPVTWSELLNEEARTISGWLKLIKERAEQIVADSDSPEAAFSGDLSTLVAGAIISGPSGCRPILELMNGLLPAETKSVEADFSRKLMESVTLVSYFSIARCCGTKLPPEANGIEQRWLPKIVEKEKRLFEEDRLTMALAATANRMPDLVPKLIGGGKLPKRIKPGEVFDFNAFGFIRYLAAAIACEADADDVLPAWLNFVACFPYKLAADSLDWIDLMLSGETIVVQLQKQPAGTVANALHRLVGEFANR